MKKITLLVGLLLAFPAPGGARAGETYYMMVFAAQRPLVNLPRYTHSFALFLKVTGDTGDPSACHVEYFPISWLGNSMQVRTFAWRPEPGTNLDLETTLGWCRDNRLPVTMWGPFQIEKGLYDRAADRASRLEAGEVRYKAVDTAHRASKVSNCIHALSDLAYGTRRLRIATPGWGDSASFFITLSLRDWIIDEKHTHDWLIARVGLAGYPVERRDLRRNPTDGPVLRVIQTLMRLQLRLGHR